MYDPEQQSFRRFMRIPAILMAVAVAQVALAGPDEPAAPLTGQQVYNNVCIACHNPPGLGGAPALGNAEAWAPRIAQGVDTLINHALHGFSNGDNIMPRKGGREDLSDEEIIGAVEYMVGQVDQ